MTEDQPIKNGYIFIKNGKIAEVCEGKPPENLKATTNLDCNGMMIMPALVDCHTHLMEYATAEIHKTQGKGQLLAGYANVLTALKSGIVALGEHHLGHPVLNQTTDEYLQAINAIPLDIKLAAGCCILGTEPLAFVSSTHPGSLISKENLSDEMYEIMADYSQFPGENIFLTATVANLPIALAPRAGEITYTFDHLKKIIKIFHDKGKKIGAHIEGDQAAMMFIEGKGDVVHHGHGISASTAKMLADKNIPLVVTPHGGTSSKPLTPEELYNFYKMGVFIAIGSDSYLPPHPDATWFEIPKDQMVGPEDYMKLCRPIFTFFLDKGENLSSVLKLFTLNGRQILGHSDDGSIKVGNIADLIISTKIPAVETTDIHDIKYVIKSGEILIARQ